MLIYRPHRSNLTDALKEAKEFKNEQEMKEFIVKQWNNQFSASDVIIDTKVVNDIRIGWSDTRYVCVKRMGCEDYIALHGVPQCIGMCATNYK